MEIKSYLLNWLKNQAKGGTPVLLQDDKEVTITTNGETTIEPDEGFDGLTSVKVTTNVSSDNNAKFDFSKVYSNQSAYTAITEIGTIDCTGKTSLNYLFNNMSGIDNIKIINTSDVITMMSTFQNCSSVKNINVFDTSNVANFSSLFFNSSLLETFPSFNTSKATTFNRLCVNCSSLKNIPVLNTSLVTDFQFAFSNCNSLTNDSLNNILKMCSDATSYRGTKTLSHIGLSQSQATTCTGLSNWSECQSAGWSTGY